MISSREGAPMRKLAAVLAISLCALPLARAGAEEADEPPRPKPMGRGGMAVKPVVCRAVEDAKGKSGQELADAIEHVVMQFHRSNYRLSALMPGDPPIACFFS